MARNNFFPSSCFETTVPLKWIAKDLLKSRGPHSHFGIKYDKFHLHSFLSSTYGLFCLHILPPLQNILKFCEVNFLLNFVLPTRNCPTAARNIPYSSIVQ